MTLRFLFINQYLEKLVYGEVNKGISIIHNLQPVSPRSALLTIYKHFLRHHLHYGEVMSDQAYNESFHLKLELYEYHVVLAITRTARGSSAEEFYQKQYFENLQPIRN